MAKSSLPFFESQLKLIIVRLLWLGYCGHTDPCREGSWRRQEGPVQQHGGSAGRWRLPWALVSDIREAWWGPRYAAFPLVFLKLWKHVLTDDTISQKLKNFGHVQQHSSLKCWKHMFLTDDMLFQKLKNFDRIQQYSSFKITLMEAVVTGRRDGGPPAQWSTLKKFWAWGWGTGNQSRVF